MAAISIGDCTVETKAALAGLSVVTIVTPATADQADTIDVSTVLSNGWLMGSAQNATDGNIMLAVGADSTTVTLPSGGTDNEARTVVLLGY